MYTSKFKISNKVLSVLLCVALLLTYQPLSSLTAFAADSHTHCFCAGNSCGDDHNANITYTALTGTLLTEKNYVLGGNTQGSVEYYYLAEDINTTQTVTIQNSVYICLNGKILTGMSSVSVFTVGNPDGNSADGSLSGTLLLTDCSNVTIQGYIDMENGRWKRGENPGRDLFTEGYPDPYVLEADVDCDLTGGVITGGGGTKVTDSAGNTVYLGGAVYLNSYSNLIMYGGNLAGNGQPDDKIAIGAGVYVKTYANVTMYGGSITGNVCRIGADRGFGGGVYLLGEHSVLNLQGGSISHNMANLGAGIYLGALAKAEISGTGVVGYNYARSGGGVYVLEGGELNLSSGGKIIGNMAQRYEYANGGAGVYINEGTFNMTGGTIQGNMACYQYLNKGYPNGGGVYLYDGAFNMSGGTITGNKTAANGGGVYAVGGAFNMSGGSITGHDADSAVSGRGVYLSSGVSCTLSGGSITGNWSSYDDWNECYYYENLVICDGNSLTVTGISEGMSFGITLLKLKGDGSSWTGVFAKPGGALESLAAYKNCFTSDEHYSIYWDGYDVALAEDGKSLQMAQGYAIKISPTPDNGTVSRSQSKAVVGDTVTITTTPDDGYELNSIAAADDSGAAVTLTPVDGKPGVYTFVMPAESAVTVTADFRVKHTHSWSYKLGETNGTIIATCNGTEGVCTVENKTVTITLNKPARTTYGGVESETATVAVDPAGAITVPTVRYQTKSGDALSEVPTAAGDYTASITMGEGNNVVTASVSYTIAKGTPQVGNVTANELYNTLDASAVILTKTDTSFDGVLALKETELSYGTNTYNWTFTPDNSNYKAITGTVEITVKDTVAPTAQHKIGTNGWKQFANFVSFGIFCKDYGTLEIQAADENGSGVKKIEYYVSTTQVTNINTIKDTDWKTYTDVVSLNPKATNYIYVRVTDNQDNFAIYSEEAVVYTDSNAIDAEVHTTYGSTEDITAKVELNGNSIKDVYSSVQSWIDTGYCTVDGDTIKLKGQSLARLGVGAYPITVYYNPMGFENSGVTDLATTTFTVIIDKAEIETAAVDVTAPEAGAAKQTAVTGGTGYSAVISWDCDTEKFGYNTAYTATVTLTADKNHKLASGLSVNGWNVVVDTNGDKATLTKTFDATRKAKLTGIGTLNNASLDKYYTGAADAAKELPATVTYTTEIGNVTVGIEWTCENYDSTVKKANKFVWTVKNGELADYDVNGIATTGKITVTNTDTINTEKVKDVTAENVTPEAKTDLENAKAELEKALEDNGDNLTEDEKKVIGDEIDRIDGALEVIDNVDAVEALIGKLPDTITKNDEAAINAANEALGALTDYEKSLVDENAKKALDDAKAALAELNKSEDNTSPNTGDNSNLWLWAALLFVSGAGLFGTVIYRKKQKEN